jgi:hypothetical protein
VAGTTGTLTAMTITPPWPSDAETLKPSVRSLSVAVMFAACCRAASVGV